jgi:amino acid transporter
MTREEIITRVLAGMAILAMLAVPFLMPFLFPRFRRWVKRGLEGDNEKLDLDELKELMRFVATALCLIYIGFIIFTEYAFGTEYGWELPFYLFAVVMGVNANRLVDVVARMKTGGKAHG